MTKTAIVGLSTARQRLRHRTVATNFAAGTRLIINATPPIRPSIRTATLPITLSSTVFAVTFAVPRNFNVNPRHDKGYVIYGSH